jgi:hypothetical protein
VRLTRVDVGAMDNGLFHCTLSMPGRGPSLRGKFPICF